jgi:hypothetical protein
VVPPSSLASGACMAKDMGDAAPAPQPRSTGGGRSAAISSAGGSSASFNVMASGPGAADADSSSSHEGVSPEATVEAAEAADSLGGLRLAFTSIEEEDGQDTHPHHLHRRPPSGSRASRSSNGALPRWRYGGSLSGDGSARAGLDPAASRRAMSSNGSSGAGAEMGEGSLSGGPRRGRRRRTHDPDPLLVAWYNAAAASGAGGVEGVSGVKDLTPGIR